MLVEEEQLGPIGQPAFPASFIGNEDSIQPRWRRRTRTPTWTRTWHSGELGEDFNITTNQ